MDTNHQLGRGMLWLGSANLLSKSLDAISGPIVLVFLSKEELGVATLAWTVTTFIENFNGLGISAAVIQAPDLAEETKASAHWYTVLVAVLVVAAVYGLAPSFAAFYHTPELTPMVRVSAFKLLFVGLANVPLALASRSLRFERLGAITSAATLLSSISTIVLAALGWGAWAPLLGNTAHGAFQLLGAVLLVPYFPRPRLAWLKLAPLARMGLNLTGAGAAAQVTRNLDYLVLGQLAGPAALGSYRVAFELAMAPTLAILQVANRFALPVYARLAAVPEQLALAIGWTARSTVLLLLAPLLFTGFVGVDLIQVLGKSPEAGTELTLRLLCAAAFLRALSQVHAPAMVATGRSRRAMVEAILTAILLGGALALSLPWLAAWPIEARVAFAWFATYAILQPIELVLMQTVVPGIAVALWRSLKVPIAIGFGVVLSCWALDQLSPLAPGVRRLGVHGACLLLLYALAVRYGAGLRLSELGRFARPRPEAATPD